MRVNLHLYIRNLVVEGHMSYQDVLDLTTYQIAAILADKSRAPGLVDPKAYQAIVEGD